MEGRDVGLTLQVLGVAQARAGHIEQARSSLGRGCQFALRDLPQAHPDHLRCEAYTALLAVPSASASAALKELSKRQTTDALLARDIATATRWFQSPISPPDWQKFPFLN